MSFKPALFKTPMVQAIAAGNKTQTRRLQGLEMVNKDPDNWMLDGLQINGSFIFHGIEEEYWMPRPWQEGDILWVRETHYAFGWWVEDEIAKSAKPKKRFIDFTTCDAGGNYGYETDIARKKHIIPGQPIQKLGWYKRPSLFMPKAAARLFLLVTDVRGQRVQNISEEDAIAEGIENYFAHDKSIGSTAYRNYRCTRKDIEADHWAHVADDAIHSFSTLWDHVNGPGAWKANPWVFAYTFMGINKPEYFL